MNVCMYVAVCMYLYGCECACEGVFAYIYVSEIGCVAVYVSVCNHMYVYMLYHHHGLLSARIPLTPSCHQFRTAIVLSKSYRRHFVFSPSWWMYVFAGWPSLVCPWVRVHRRTSLMSSLLLQQCPECLARLGYFMR